MRGKIKIICLILVIIGLISLIILSAQARQGCCSHHGGVCGCRCCDGTSLSATCAPYYPNCSQKKIELPSLPKLPKVETNTPKPQSQTFTAQVSDKASKSYNWAYWLVGLAVMSGIVLVWSRKKK